MLGLTVVALLENAMPGQRTTKQAAVVLSLDSKPVEGDWNGPGRHTTDRVASRKYFIVGTKSSCSWKIKMKVFNNF
ncbi:uncharacterized protein LOC113310040 isoform X2 [Papaver somniferum]|nr:uncharacterized protein LOC113310040 isoform X2 [Papaver somniferum]